VQRVHRIIYIQSIHPDQIVLQKCFQPYQSRFWINWYSALVVRRKNKRYYHAGAVVWFRSRHRGSAIFPLTSFKRSPSSAFLLGLAGLPIRRIAIRSPARLGGLAKVVRQNEGEQRCASSKDIPLGRLIGVKTRKC